MNTSFHVQHHSEELKYMCTKRPRMTDEHQTYTEVGVPPRRRQLQPRPLLLRGEGPRNFALGSCFRRRYPYWRQTVGSAKKTSQARCACCRWSPKQHVQAEYHRLGRSSRFSFISVVGHSAIILVLVSATSCRQHSNH